MKTAQTANGNRWNKSGGMGDGGELVAKKLLISELRGNKDAGAFLLAKIVLIVFVRFCAFFFTNLRPKPLAVASKWH